MGARKNWDPADRSFRKTTRAASAESEVRPGRRLPTLRTHRLKIREAAPEATIHSLPAESARRKYFGESTYHELGTQRSLTGAGPVLEALQTWKAAMPDVRGTVTGAIEEGDRVVLEIMWEGTQTGELATAQGTIPATGKRQRTPAAFVFVYEGGQLAESRHYFDMLTYLQQVGAGQ